jgi:hypothetical protein
MSINSTKFTAIVPAENDGSRSMNGKIAVVLLSGLLFACVQTQPPEASAPPSAPPAPTAAPAPAAVSVPADRFVIIRRATCDTLLALTAEDREDASMFYIGYQASRFRARAINVGLIPSIEAQALNYCAANPNRTVAQAFAEAYLVTR